MLIDHILFMETQLADSRLETTRVYWRGRLGFPDHIVNDPRPLADIAKELHELERIAP